MAKYLSIFLLFACASVDCLNLRSCQGRCGQGYYKGSSCQCDYECLGLNECCSDFESLCTTKDSCKGRCGEPFSRGNPCHCDFECTTYNQCCSDYESQCLVEESSNEDMTDYEEQDAPPTATPSEVEVSTAPATTVGLPSTISPEVPATILTTEDTTSTITTEPATILISSEGTTTVVSTSTITTEDKTSTLTTGGSNSMILEGSTIIPTEGTTSEGSSSTILSEDPTTSITTVYPTTTVTTESPTTTVPTDEPTTTVTTEIPTSTVPTDEPSTSLTTEESASTVPTDEPSTSLTTEESASTVPTDEQTTTVTTELHTSTVPTNEPAITVAKDSPKSTVPTEEPTTTVTTELHTSTVPTNEPTITIAKDSPKSTVPTEEPTTTVTIEVPASTLPTDEQTTDITTEMPASTVPTDEPTTTVTTEESASTVPTDEPTTTLTTHEPTTTKTSTVPTVDLITSTLKPATNLKIDPTKNNLYPQDPSFSIKPTQKPTKPNSYNDKTNTDKDFQADDYDSDLCSGRPISGLTTLKNGTIVAFRGHYFWTLDRDRNPNPARLITNEWGIPSPIDTVFTRCNCQGKTYFFKGNKYWRFEDGTMDSGFPKYISQGFGRISHITAALSIPQYRSRNEVVIFFKRGGLAQKYTYQMNPTCGSKPMNPLFAVRNRFRRETDLSLGRVISISRTWKGFPSVVTSAVSVPSRVKEGYKYYVFSQNKYYSMKMEREKPVILKSVSGQRENTANSFFKCPQSNKV